MRIDIKDQIVRDQAIRLGKSDRIHFIMESVLENCRVEFRTAGKNIVIANTTFVDCTLVAAPKLTGYQFHEVRFEGCTFEGTFRNCDFGARDGFKEQDFGSVENCSFAAATLDFCTFFARSVQSLRWPPWPHIVILDPLENLPDWERTPFPPDMSLDLSFIDSKDWSAGKSLRAVAFHLPSQNKLRAVDEIWPLVQAKPYVVFEGKALKPPATEAMVASIRDANEREIDSANQVRNVVKPWAGLLFAKLLDVATAGKGKCKLTFDTRYLLKRIHEAPPFIDVTFECDALSLDALRSTLLKVGPGKFTVRALDPLAAGLSIRGQRKTLGTLEIPNAHAEFTTPDGRPLDLERFERCVEKYWLGGA